jgi:nicotinamide-nucleotide amidase
MAETLDPALPPIVQDRADRVLKVACDKHLMLATAESCTGGLLAALLTDVPGCSHAFERGFVVYTDAAKAQLLAIDPAEIERHGAVSREIAVAMAHGALARSEADLAVSVTGFAGPGAPGDEEGLVHLACARRNGPTAHRCEHLGPQGRQGVRLASLGIALDMLEQALDDG